MAVTVAATTRAISDILDGSKIIQMASVLPILERDVAPVSSRVLSSKIGRGRVAALTFKHREDQILPYEAVQTAASAAAAGVITCAADYVYFNEGDLWRNERTDEVILIDGFSTRNATVDCVNGVGSTPDAGGAINDVWHRIGSAHEEGSKAALALMTKEVEKTFYIQIHKKATQLTHEAAGTAVYHGNDRLHQAAKKMMEMKLDIENSSFWGVGSADASGGAGTYPQPSSVGLYNYCSTNVASIASLTFAELRDFFDALRKYHTSGKFAYVTGSAQMNIISDFAYDAIRTTVGSETWGVDIRTLKLGSCEVELIEQPLWDGNYTSQIGFGLPKPIPEFLKLKTFNNMGLQWRLNVDDNDDNMKYKDSLRCHLGAEIWEEKRFGVMKDVISG